MLRKIKIFIASSIEELREDRVEIGDFFRQLNDIYIDRGIHFSLIKCEDYDNSIAAEGKQSQYDEEIRDSEISFFLFFKKVGDYTKHEFEVALESYKEKKRPQIVTYFKYVENGEQASEEISRFMQMLSGELNHYYNTYGNIDTLKLGMLMQIKLLNLDSAEIKIDGGNITVHGEKVASCENIPMFSQNARLEELKRKLEEINGEYFKLRSEAVNDDSKYLKFAGVAKEREKLENQIKEIEEKTLSAAEHMHKANNEGAISERQKAAYRLLEKGDIDGALKLLDKEEIMADVERGSDISRYGNSLIKSSVNELIQRIYLLYMSKGNSNKYKEIEQLYNIVCEKTTEFNLDKESIYHFAHFLNNRKKYADALKWAEKAELYAKIEEKGGLYLASIYILCGVLYNTHSRLDDAEHAYEKALALLEKEDKTNVVTGEIATTLINLANVYTAKPDYNKAVETLKKAFVYAEEAVKSNTYTDVSRYCRACQNMGINLMKTGEMSEAITYFKKAMNIIKPMYEVNPEGTLYESAKVMTYMRTVATVNKEEKDALYFAKTAVEYYEKIVAIDPDVYEAELATAYVDYAQLLNDNNKAMEYIKKGMDILKKYYGRNPAAYARALAGAHTNMGIRYFKMGESNIDDAVSELSKSIKIYKKQVEDGAVNFEGNLASTYNVLAVGLTMNKRVKASVQYYKLGIELCKKHAKNNELIKGLLDEMTSSYEKVKEHLAGNANQNQKNNTAKENVNKNTNPQNPIADAIKKSKSDMDRGEKLLKSGKFDEAEKAFKSAMTLSEKIRKEDAAPLISMCCYKLAVICENRNQHNKALDYCREMAQNISASERFISGDEAGDMLKGYGNLLARANKPHDATEIYMKAINGYERAQKETGKEYYHEIGEIYDYLTVLAANAGAVNDAIMVGTLALANHTMCKDPVKSNTRHANTSLNLAHLYAKKGDKETVEKMCLGAVGNYKWLVLNKSDEYAANMTEAFNMLIQFYKQSPVGFKKIENAYLDMISVFEKLCEKNFKKHGENLASLYESVSNVVVGLFNMKKVKEYKSKAKEIREALKR